MSLADSGSRLRKIEWTTGFISFCRKEVGGRKTVNGCLVLTDSRAKEINADGSAMVAEGRNCGSRSMKPGLEGMTCRDSCLSALQVGRGRMQDTAGSLLIFRQEGIY